MVFWGHGPRKIDRSAGNMCVGVDTAGKHNHACCIQGSTTLYGLDEFSGVVDAEISNLAVDLICGVKDLAASYSKHGTNHSNCCIRILLCAKPHVIRSKWQLRHILNSMVR